MKKVFCIFLSMIFLFLFVSCTDGGTPTLFETNSQTEARHEDTQKDATRESAFVQRLSAQDAEDRFSVREVPLPPLLEDEELLWIRFEGNEQWIFVLRDMEVERKGLYIDDSGLYGDTIWTSELLCFSHDMELQWSFHLMDDLIVAPDFWGESVWTCSIRSISLTESENVYLLIELSRHLSDGLYKIDNYICKLNSLGEPVSELTLLEKAPELKGVEQFKEFIVDREERVYVYGCDAYASFEEPYAYFAVFSMNGEFLYTIEDKNGDMYSGHQFRGLFMYASNLYIQASNHANSEKAFIFRVDHETQSLVTEFVKPSIFANFTSIQMNNNSFYMERGDGIYQVFLEDDESIPLVLWKNLEEQVSTRYRGFSVLSNDLILLMVEEGNTGLQGYLPDNKLYFLERNKGNADVEKAVLTIGGCDINQDAALLSAVNTFNRMNTDVRAEIIDYTQSVDDTLSYSDKIKQMNIRMMSGEAPDIFYDSVSGLLNFPQYASTGLLEDLNGLITADSSFDDKDYSELIYSFATQNNELFYTVGSYSVHGFYAKKAVAFGCENWTIDEFDSFVRSLPGGKAMLSEVEQELLLRRFVHVYFSELIDYSVSTSNFTSENFKDVLRFCKDYGMRVSDMDWEKWESHLLRQGDIAIAMRFADIYCVDEWRIKWNESGSDITLLEYPGRGYLASSRGTFAISSASEQKGAAWDFVKLLWSEDIQDEYMKERKIPVHKGALESAISMIQIETAGEQHELNTPLPDDGVEELLSILDRVTRVELLDEDVFNIVWEETQAYFAGQKDIDTTAGIIQDRVTTYLNQM